MLKQAFENGQIDPAKLPWPPVDPHPGVYVNAVEENQKNQTAAARN